MISRCLTKPKNVVCCINRISQAWLSDTAIPSDQSAKIPDVPGLSSKVISPQKGEVGPGASKSGKYKNPEYYSYHATSYFEAEIEMAKYRLPQPSAK